MTGEELKKRREELGLSLTEVSLVTKISLRVLHAIEAMDKAQLPAPIFLKGLLKSYAQHLKLDADTVTKAYLSQIHPAPVKPVEASAANAETNSNATSAAAAPIPEPVEKKVEKEKTVETPSYTEKSSPETQAPPFKMPVKALWIGISAVGLVAIVAISRMMSHYQSEVPTEQKSAETKQAQKPEEKPVAKTEEKKFEVTGQVEMTQTSDHPVETSPNTTTGIIPILPSQNKNPADSAAVVAPSVPTPVPVPTQANNTAAIEEKKPEEKKIEEKKAEEKPVQVQAQAPTPTPTASPAPASTHAPIPKPEEKPIAKIEEKKMEEKKPEEKKAEENTAKSKVVILEALDKVNIVIKKGSQQYKVSLQPDEIHTVRYSDSIEVEVSDGGAVNVIQNGHDNGVAGDLGKPKKINL